MTYLTFKSAIQAELNRHASGKTWNELRSKLRLPYAKPCPEWTRKLEREVGLKREKGRGPALVWRLKL